jgi:hypothetical protein
MPNHLILLASVGEIWRHDGWKGSDIVQLQSTSHCHLLHHPEGKHLGVLSSSASGRDISTYRVHMAYHLKNILCVHSTEWLDEDLRRSPLLDTLVMHCLQAYLLGQLHVQILRLLANPSGLDFALAPCFYKSVTSTAALFQSCPGYYRTRTSPAALTRPCSKGRTLVFLCSTRWVHA